MGSMVDASPSGRLAFAVLGLAPRRAAGRGGVGVAWHRPDRGGERGRGHGGASEMVHRAHLVFPRTSDRGSIGIGAIRFLLLRSPVNAIAARARRAGRGGGLHAAKTPFLPTRCRARDSRLPSGFCAAVQNPSEPLTYRAPCAWRLICSSVAPVPVL